MSFSSSAEAIIQLDRTKADTILTSENDLGKTNAILQGACQCQMKVTALNSSCTMADAEYVAACRDFIDSLTKELSAAKDYDAPLQQVTLQALTTVLSDSSGEGTPLDNKVSSDLIANHNYDLFDAIQPFLYIAGKDVTVRQSAVGLFRIIAAGTPDQELYIWATEFFSTTHWARLLKEGKQDCIQATVQSVEWVRALGQAFEKSPKGRLYDTIQYPVDFCVTTLGFIGKVLLDFASLGSATHAPSEWDTIVCTLSSSILDLIEFGTKTFPPLEKPLEQVYSDPANDSEETRCRYLFLYLLIQFYEEVVLHSDLRLGQAYYEQYHPKYNVKRPDNSGGWEALFSENEKGNMLDIVHRCMKLTVASGVTFDSVWRLSHTASFIDNQDHDIHSEKYTLSRKGIASLMALSMYDQCVYSQVHKKPNLNMFPTAIDLTWLGREFLGVLTSLLVVPEDSSCVDKALMVFSYLADNANIEVELDMFTEKIMNHDGKPSKGYLLYSFQAMTSVACMSENPAYRFLALQLVAELVAMCSDEARMMLLMLVFEECPLVELKIEMVGNLKDLINLAFESKKVVAFNSRVIVDKFFPVLFQVPKHWTAGNFAKEAEFHVKLLHFYYFLLKRDKTTNKTMVWNSGPRKMVKRNYVEPLRKALQRLDAATRSNRRYLPHQVLSETPKGSGDDLGEAVQREMFMQILLSDALKRIEDEWKSGPSEP